MGNINSIIRKVKKYVKKLCCCISSSNNDNSKYNINSINSINNDEYDDDCHIYVNNSSHQVNFDLPINVPINQKKEPELVTNLVTNFESNLFSEYSSHRESNYFNQIELITLENI